MNYTKNYHLPQWVKEDRVLMEDFNAAMANIESGLSTNAQTAAAANSKTAGDAASATAAAETRALARLRKLGYDLSQVNARGIIAGAQPGRTKCLVFNGLNTPEEKSKVSGFLCTPDRQGVRLGPQTVLTLERLSSETSGWTTTEKPGPEGTATHSVRFHSSQTGTVTQIQIWLRNAAYLSLPTIDMKCRDLGTGTEVYAKNFRSGDQRIEYAKYMIDVSIPLEAGHTYQLEMSTRTYSFEGALGFGDEAQPALVGTASSPVISTGTIRESLVLDAPAHIALAVVHCAGGDAAPVLTAGGKTLVPQYARQGTSIRGDTCTEREYYLEGNWSGTVPLTVSCQSSAQDLTVYDVEFCLI